MENKKMFVLQVIILIVTVVCLAFVIAVSVKINKDYLTPEEQISAPLDPDNI